MGWVRLHAESEAQPIVVHLVRREVEVAIFVG